MLPRKSVGRPPAGCHTGRSAWRLTESWGDAVPSSLQPKCFCRPDWKLPKTFNCVRFPTKGRFGIGCIKRLNYFLNEQSNQLARMHRSARAKTGNRVPELEGASQRSLMALVYCNNIIKSHKIPKWQQTRQHKQCKTPPRTKKKKRCHRLSIFTSSKNLIHAQRRRAMSYLDPSGLSKPGPVPLQYHTMQPGNQQRFANYMTRPETVQCNSWLLH